MCVCGEGEDGERGGERERGEGKGERGGGGERERENWWSIAKCEIFFSPTYFISCNGPCAPKET